MYFCFLCRDEPAKHHERVREALQHTATHCNTLQHTATRSDTPLNDHLIMREFVRHRNALQHTTTHCDTLQHTATHCNTPLIDHLVMSEFVSRPPSYLSRHKRVRVRSSVLGEFVGILRTYLTCRNRKEAMTLHRAHSQPTNLPEDWAFSHELNIYIYLYIHKYIYAEHMATSTIANIYSNWRQTASRTNT